MFKLHIKLKNGEDREYYWHEINYVDISVSTNMFIVRDTTESLIFAASMDRLEYYERIEE